MQKRVSSDPSFVRDSLAIRIGLHHGDTLVEAADVYGDAVNTAARMASLAKREQIITTASTVTGVTNVGPLRTRSVGSARVSGKQLPIEIVDVMWQDDTSNVTTRAARGQADRSRAAQGAADAALQEPSVRDRRTRAAVLARPRGRPTTSMIDAEWVSRTRPRSNTSAATGCSATARPTARGSEGRRRRRAAPAPRRTASAQGRHDQPRPGNRVELPDFVLVFRCVEAQ